MHSAQLRAWRQISHWQSSQARWKGELCQSVFWHLLISQYPRFGVYIMFTDLDSFIFYSFFSVVTNLNLGSPGHVSWRHTLLYTHSGFFANYITAWLSSVARLNSDYFNTLHSPVTGFSTIRHITMHPPPIPYTKYSFELLTKLLDYFVISNSAMNLSVYYTEKFIALFDMTK